MSKIRETRETSSGRLWVGESLAMRKEKERERHVFENLRFEQGHPHTPQTTFLSKVFDLILIYICMR